MRLPSGLVPRGRGIRYFKAVSAAYTLGLHEAELLAEIAHMLDQIDALRATLAPMEVGAVPPAVIELRQQQAELRRLMSQLELPKQADLPAMRSARSARAAKAAKTRWAVHSNG